MYKGKIILITGGTGSFGNAVLKKLIELNAQEIRIFSRDEKKQDDMRRKYNNPLIKFFIGDVRNLKSIKNAVIGVDFIFHAAALKQVPSCEFYPLEAVYTNILGTENLLDAAIDEGVKKVICLSTDKAVYPINAMGMSKALMEKVAISKSRNSPSTKICITRYGNVMASRGSVIPLFINQIQSNIPISITDPNMTRFMMTLDEAVSLVFFAFENGNSGDIFVQKSPSAKLKTLADALCSLFGHEKYPKINIGTRHGEKLHEVLLSREEIFFAEDLNEYFKVPSDQRDLNYNKYYIEGKDTISKVEDYNSHNTKQLNKEETKSLLLQVSQIKDLIIKNDKKKS